jgi:RsiW-degrading membrane proteinase PrsW (M82 family)
MAITYAAGAGTIITSPIIYETLGSQSGADIDEVYLNTASGVPSGHTNYGGNVGTGAAGDPAETDVFERERV